VNTKKITFVDAGVLIAAFRGNEPDSTAAFRILGGVEREFASSIFVKLEVLPKPVFYEEKGEIEFYETFFESVDHWCVFTDELLQEALEEAKKSGLAALDALHIVAAAHCGADQLVTVEKKRKPIHRTDLCKVVSLHE